MTPLDPRRDSAETPAVSGDIGTVIRKLDEMRSDQKEMGLKVDELIKRDGQRQTDISSLKEDVSNKMLDLTQRLTRAEGRSDSAYNLAGDAKRAVSDTQHKFDMTLAAVNATTNRIADKTETVSTAAGAHTAQLDTLSRVNEDQTAKIEAVTSLLETSKRHLPLILTAAILAAEVVGKFIETLLGVIHH